MKIIIKEINKLSKNNFLRLSTTYFFLKIIGCSLVLLFLSLYDSRIFSYTDLEFYNDNSLNIFSANYFFSSLVKLIGYTPDNFLSYKFIFISFLISFFITIPYIYLSSKYHQKKSIYIYIFLISFHPYLSLYSLKLDTSLFGIISISCFTFFIFENYRNKYLLSFFVTSLSSLFRNALLPFSICQYLNLYFLKQKILFFNKYLFF